MSKKMKTLIVIIIIAFIGLNVVIIAQMLHKNKDYTKNLRTDEEKEVVKDTLTAITDDDLKKEIKDHVDVDKFYKEIKKIDNYEYTSEMTSFLVKANNKLKGNNSSLVQEYNKGTPIFEILNLTCGDDFLDFTNSYLIGDDENKEYLETMSNGLYTKLLEKIKNMDYDGVISEVDTLLETYKFTASYNHKIANVYHDATVLKNKSNVSDLDILPELHDIGVYTIQVMALFTEDRYSVIEDKNVPYISSSVAATVSSVDIQKISINSENYKDVYKLAFDRFSPTTDDPLYSLNIAKVTFSSGDNLFDAYVVINADKSCSFYTIIPQNTEKTYETLAKYLQLSRQQMEQYNGQDE